MTAFGKANYERYRDFNHGVSAVTGEPLPEWDDMPVHIQSGWSAGADAVALVLAECPVDEDAPGNEPAKVIVVTEANGGERRYDADGYAITDGTLFVKRYGITVACHPAGTWTSFRAGDAIAGDTQRKAVSIAKRALRNISALGTAPGHGLDDAQAIATDALDEIFTETEA